MLEDKIQAIKHISEEAHSLQNKIIAPYVTELDSLIKEIDEKLLGEMSKDLVAYYHLKLANMLYFVNASVKVLEQEKKTALREKQGVYNNAVLEIRLESIQSALKPSDKKTQTDIVAEASEVAKEDIIASDVYDTALSAVTDRIKDGWNVVSSLKYRFNSIVQEMQSEVFARNARMNLSSDYEGE